MAAVSACNQNLQNLPDPEVFSGDTTEKIRSIDVSFNKISSLNGVDKYPALEEIILDNNAISVVDVVDQFPKVKLLSLNNNVISELEDFLSSLERLFPTLSYLSCLGNPCCPDQLTDAENTEDDYRRYRYYVIFRLPNLKFLDSKPVTPKEKREAQRHGPFLRRIKIQQTSVATESPQTNEEFGPIPVSKPQDSSAYKQCKYVYRGIHSEGNRFIRDNQL